MTPPLILRAALPFASAYSRVLALLEYSLAGLIDPMLLVYFVIFYLLASLVYGGRPGWLALW